MLMKTARAPIRGRQDHGNIVLRLQHGKIASRFERIALNTDENFYLDVWAVSSYEKFGLNENADGFEHEELQRSFPTFVDAWVCLDHNNEDEGMAVGRVIDAVYTPDQYVRIADAVNRKKVHARHPGLEEKIESKQITDTSMGCLARESVCTLPKCANVAIDESQYCDHVTKMRGQIICNASTNWEQIKCGELNRGVIFFEDSIITDDEGADRNAKIIAKLASRRSGHKSITANAVYNEIVGLSKTSSAKERALLAQLLENLEKHIL